MSPYVQVCNNDDVFLEHRLIYEAHFGPIPNGFHIHHRDENPRNNQIDNLELLSPGDHKKMHSRRYRRRVDGGWDKICHTCGEAKPLSEFHTQNGGTTHRRDCKPCRNKVEGKRLARRKAEDPDFAEKQRQFVRSWYARKKLQQAAPMDG